MNHYQKLLVCLFRSIGLLGFGYLAFSIVGASLVMRGSFMMSISVLWPALFCLALLFFVARPLARLITFDIAAD